MDMANINTRRNKLQGILITNYTLSETDITPINRSTNFYPQTEIIKPPPIYIQTQIIDPLIKLLEQERGNENFTLK